MPGFVLHSADKEVRLREDVASKRSIGVDQALDSQFSALSSALIHFSVSVIIGLVSENVMMRTQDPYYTLCCPGPSFFILCIFSNQHSACILVMDQQL